MSTQPTLAKLNETDDPKSMGGVRLCSDGQGNELWHFPSVNKGANRFSDGETVVWDDDINGWNYTDEFALD